MTKQVNWNKQVLDEFIKEAMLTEEEIFIMETRVKGMTITKQADQLHMSPDNVKKMIARLKKKYDIVQAYSPILPKRKPSAKETYMDTH